MIRTLQITIFTIIIFNPIYTLAQNTQLKGVYEQSIVPKDSLYGNPKDTIGKKLIIRHAYDNTMKTLEIKGRDKFRFVGEIFNDLEMSYSKVISSGTYYQNGDTIVLNLKRQTRYLYNKQRIRNKLSAEIEFIILESGDLRLSSQCIFKKL